MGAGKPGILRAGSQEDQVGNAWPEAEALAHRQNTFFLRETSALLLRPFFFSFFSFFLFRATCVAHASAMAIPDTSPTERGQGSKLNPGVPVVAQWLTNPTRNHEVAGSVPALAQWVNDPALP